ncbi:hypothetical protein [Solibacillus isronensis]|uniref:hypothetical protein n=1 Tax=Solibacillus isronensis TaxID=412383 RepID=UPI0039A09D5A
MFYIKANDVKEVIESMAGAAKFCRDEDASIGVIAENGVVKFVLKNALVEVEKEVKAIVKKDFKFIASAHEMLLKIGVLPNDVEAVFGEIQNGHVSIKWGRSNGLILFTEHASKLEAVAVPEIEGDSITLDWGYYSRIFAHFCSSNDSEVAATYPITKGVHFGSNAEGKLVVEASDSVRAINQVVDGQWLSKGFSIPQEAMKAVNKLVKEAVTVGLVNDGSRLLIQAPNTKIITRIIDGDFVDTSKLYVDENSPFVWKIDRLELLEVARRVKRLSGALGTIKFTHTNGKYLAIYENVLQQSLGVVCEGESSGFALSVVAIESALTALKSDEVFICINAAGAPVTFLGSVTLEAESADAGTIEIENVKVMLGQVSK